MEYNTQEIMERFSKERKKNNYTQEALANAVGVNAKTISAYECGRKNPSLKMFIKMCVIINANVNYIVYGKNNMLEEMEK